MKQPSSPARLHRKRHLFQSLLLFLFLTGLGHFAVDTERRGLEQNRRDEVARTALNFISRLQAELNANVFLANGMFTLLAAVPRASDAQFELALKALYQRGRYVRNVALAPGNRITHIYPLAGNEAALGLYYPDEPTQWGAVKKAIDRRGTVVAGPVKLRQGGSGLISRTPVFQEDGGYWGVLSLVLDTASLFQAVGLDSQVGGIRFAPRGKDGEGAQGDVFFGDAATFSDQAIQMSFNVPGGDWAIAALPEAGWNISQSRLYALEAAALMGALLLAFVFHGYQRGRMRTEASEQRLRALMETVPDGVVVINEKGIIQEFNPAAETLFGYPSSELLGTSLNRLMPEADARQHDQHIRLSSQTGVRAMGGGRQIVCKRKNGSAFPAEITVGNMRAEEGRVFVGVVRDNTQRKEYEQRLLDLANTDSLTGVLNRRAFMEAGKAMHQLAQRYGRPLSLMMIDADHFKKVNDTHGHHVGDQVLINLAETARACLRATDKLGRLGGEEFAVLMPETDPDKAVAVAGRLLGAVREAMVSTEAGATVRYTVSIGLATVTPQSPGIEDLMRRADAALYEAKAEGRDRWRAAPA